MRVSWIARDDDGSDCDLKLPEPEKVEGWTRDRIGIRVSAKSQLRSCRLGAERGWQGWPIPADSLLDLTKGDGKVGLVLPIGTSMAAPEIGHPITATGGFAFNSDGSLDNFYFQVNDPLLVAGKRLWNTIHWVYDPATFGQGRHRRALTVRGSLASLDNDMSEAVAIRLADGQVTSDD